MHLFSYSEAVVQRCSVKKVFLEIAQNSQENTCARDFFLIKLKACNFIKKSLWHRCFPVNFAKFLRTPFLTEHLRWLFQPILSFMYALIIKQMHNQVHNLRWLFLPIPRFLYALIIKQVHNQMFFRVGQNFQIFRAQVVLLIMLSFLNDKTKCFTGKY